MSYGKVKDAFWTDKKVRSWTDDAKLLALYFLTGPHRNLLGCMRVPTGYLLEDLGWPAARLADAIAVLCRSNFIERDADGWTLILNQLKHDPLAATPNHVKAAVAVADGVPPESPIYHGLAKRFTAALDAIGKASVWHPKTNPYAIDIPEPSPFPEPAPEPEPAQEQSDSDPVELMVEAWNDLADECDLARVQRISTQRKAKAGKRLRDCGGLDGWMTALDKIKATPGLRGENSKGWKATFDFLMQESSFIKLMEGNYDGWKEAGRQPASILAIAAELIAEEGRS